MAPPGPRIGSGASAEVFALDEGRVLKLFRAHVAPAVADREFAAARAAFAAGLPVARPIERVRLDGRDGIVSVRLCGTPVLRRARHDPVAMLSMLRAMAQLQAAVHRAPVAPAGLPALRELLMQRILASQAPHRAIAVASHLPADAVGRLCHNDLHPGNLLRTPAGLAIVDWGQAALGPPPADVARSWLLIRFADFGRAMRWWPPLRLARRVCAAHYLSAAVAEGVVDRAGVARWLLPVAVAWAQPGGRAFRPGLDRLIARLASRAHGR